ncbi:hypothetical protein ACQXX4_04265, partial [Corynebacterium diphtheriae]
IRHCAGTSRDSSDMRDSVATFDEYFVDFCMHRLHIVPRSWASAGHIRTSFDTLISGGVLVISRAHGQLVWL